MRRLNPRQRFLRITYCPLVGYYKKIQKAKKYAKIIVILNEGFAR
jgi:hypothetical protein